MRILPFFPAAVFCVAACAATSPREALNQIPAWFEPSPGGAAYVSRGMPAQVRLDQGGAKLGQIRLSFSGARRAAKLEGLEGGGAMTNYLLGARRDLWRTNVPHYARVAARSVYPGVDVVYYAAGKELEYDFIVAPGADPSRIGLRFTGGERPRLDSDGALWVGGGLRQRVPVAWQERSGERTQVAVRYRIARGGEVKFELGTYDRSLPLVIDPVIGYAGYLGGDRGEVIHGVLASPDGGWWLAGVSRSQLDTPADTAPYAALPKAQADAFLAKIMPNDNGWKLVYWTYIGGSVDDEATCLAWMGSRIAIAGNTSSGDWPVVGDKVQDKLAGESDAFVALYDPNASGTDCLTYSTFYGGVASEHAQAMAVRNLTITVVGYTNSGSLTGLVDKTSLQSFNQGGLEAFVFQVAPFAGAGNTLTYATFLGGKSTDIANAVAVDAAGFIYIAGTTMSADFPVAGAAYQAYPRSTGDAFLAKLDPNKVFLDQLVYATYFGGSDLDTVQAMTLDSQNRLWVTGYTFSEDLPVTPGVYQLSNSGGVDAFLALLDPSKGGSGFVVYCTYFGGSGAEVPYALSLDPASGAVTIAGYTTSKDFPVKDMPGYTQPAVQMSEAFAARFDSARTGQNSLVWSTMFGGSGSEAAIAVGLDKQGNALVAGFTGSADLTVGDAPGKGSPPGVMTGFFFRLQ